MNVRLNILFALAATCALACNGAPKDGEESDKSLGARDAVETNVLRGSCDAGACDAGEVLEEDPSEDIPCDDDDDCPDDLRCGRKKICMPKTSSETH